MKIYYDQSNVVNKSSKTVDKYYFLCYIFSSKLQTKTYKKRVSVASAQHNGYRPLVARESGQSIVPGIR